MSLFRPWTNEDSNCDDEVQLIQQPGCSNPRTPVKNKKSAVIGTGARLRKQTVAIVKNVRTFVQSVRDSGGVIAGSNVNKVTAAATGVSVSTVKRIVNISDVNDYHTPTKKKIQKRKFQFDKIDDFTRDLLRRTIFEYYKNGKSPTVEALTESMRQKTAQTNYEFPYSAATLYRLLVSMGFQYKSAPKKSLRTETPDIIVWRYRYLHAIRDFRSQGYDDVYLDETWFDSNSCKMKNWIDDSDNCALTTPDNKGDRIVIVHCGGRSGFVSDALLVTHTKMADAPADFHGSIKADIFETWLEENVLKRLEKPSVIVIDNASYHSRVLNTRPNSSWRKNDILLYMTEKNIPVPQPIPIIPVLLQITEDHIPFNERKKKYAVDELALMYGHTILRLPPYHCILNPIEMVWSEIKRRAGSQNLTKRPLEDIIKIIKEACNHVTPEKWRNYIQHVEKIEDSYRSLQSIFDDASNRRICIELGESSDESEDEDEDLFHQ